MGSPTTMVLAANLSHAAISEALRLGRIVLKMENFLDPDLDLLAYPVASVSGGRGGNRWINLAPHFSATVVPVRIGGTISQAYCRVNFTATVALSAQQLKVAETRGGYYLVLVRNNEQTLLQDIPSVVGEFIYHASDITQYLCKSQLIFASHINCIFLGITVLVLGT